MRQEGKYPRPASAIRSAGIVALGVWLTLVFAPPVWSGEPLRLTLDDAITVALERGHELGMAEAAEEAARARVGQSRSAFLPAVSASASYTKLDEIPYMDGSQFGDMFAPLMAPFEYLVCQQDLHGR